MDNRIGYRWLAERYRVEAVQPLPVDSQVGPTRRTTETDGLRHETYTEALRPESTLAGHLTFALKHEGVNLELLARLCAVIPAEEMAAWVNRERTGQYARRAGFFWEWFTGRELPGVEPVATGNYVNALDSEKLVAASSPVNNMRWRVRDNLPGTQDFCPTVRRTPGVEEITGFDCAAALDELQAEYGTDLLLRSAVWLTIKESRASFQIEHEERHLGRVQRFAAAMERHCGNLENPLGSESLKLLQGEVIGQSTTLKAFGLRASPVFVGESSVSGNVVHYLAPDAADVPAMLEGLHTFLAKTQGGCRSVIRAAVAAFGFVYIHPLADGNGRIHRFLINDVLRRDGAVPSPFILPVSATITEKAQSRARYDEILEVFSRPLMARYAGQVEFTAKPNVFPDGIKSNVLFHARDEANFAWRYPDLTPHVLYIGELIRATVLEEMRSEASLLRAFDNARQGVKDLIDGPNQDIDRIIRAVRQHNGVSNKLAQEFPPLADPVLAAGVTAAVFDAFAEGAETEARGR